jgi:general L-amino acid transport system permease protein
MITEARVWIRQNLFATRAGSVLTIIFGLFLGYAAYRLAWFVFVSSDWEIVRRNLRVFMVGRYPQDKVWRLWAALYLGAAVAGFCSGATLARAEQVARATGTIREAGPTGRWAWLRRYWPALGAVAVVLSQTRTWIPTVLTLGMIAVLVVSRLVGRRLPQMARFAWPLLLVGFLVAVYLMAGPGGVNWNKWGGFHLTVFVTVAGIALSFPFGVLLALGRRSSLPALRAVTVGFIETIRGVPLVTLLFVSLYLVPLFFPNTIEPPSKVARVLIVITLFEAAYVAETVRGGLQSIPRGQYEAAHAIGLRQFTIMRVIVLPQALRAVIPGMVGQFISLFKDTSLLQIIGFAELLELTENAAVQPQFFAQRLHTVAFSFAAILYWAGSYTMSRESRRLETRLGLSPGGRR